MNKNEIIRAVVLDWLDTEPDYLAFIEAFPEDEFEDYAEDDRVLQEIYQLALEEYRSVRYNYSTNTEKGNN